VAVPAAVLGRFCSPGDYAILKFLPNSRHYRETTVAHQHASDEEFYIIDHDGTRYGSGDLVWLRKGTEHTSYSPSGCLIAVYLEAEES
jgi:hypothetical protein